MPMDTPQGISRARAAADLLARAGCRCGRACRSQTAASTPPRAMLWPRMCAVSGSTSAAAASSRFSTRGAT